MEAVQGPRKGVVLANQVHRAYGQLSLFFLLLLTKRSNVAKENRNKDSVEHQHDNNNKAKGVGLAL